MENRTDAEKAFNERLEILSVKRQADSVCSSGWWIDIGINLGVLLVACGVVVALYFFIMNIGLFFGQG